MMISIVVAVAINGCIGSGNRLPWKLKADMRHFRSVTMGKPIIMGRKTYESIGKALPGRRNIIITSQPGFNAPGCEIFPSLVVAIQACQEAEEICIIGGGTVFQHAIDLMIVQRMYLTLVQAEPQGDAWFTIPDNAQWSKSFLGRAEQDADNEFPVEFWQYDQLRRSS